MKRLESIMGILHLDDRNIQLILRGCELTELVYTLKGSPQNIREKIYANMSVKACSQLQNELDSLGAVKLEMVESYQREFLKKANNSIGADKIKIAIASDHAGFPLKEKLKKALQNYDIVDFGTNSEESMDYPDTGFNAAKAVSTGECDKGVLICGSGIGMSIVANKVPGIRASLVHTVQLAELTRKHNNSNILVLAGRFISEYLAKDILQKWLNTPFDGGRHQNRLDKINKYEEEEKK